jgi:hypothetical protein
MLDNLQLRLVNLLQETAEFVEMQPNQSLAELVKTIGSLPDLAASAVAPT